MGASSDGFEHGFENFRNGYRQLLETTLDHRKLFAVCFLAFCVLSMGLVFFLGEDFFPSVDAGLMRLHVRARAGLRVEETARLCDEIEQLPAAADPQKGAGTRSSTTSGFPTPASTCRTATPA